MNNQFVSALGKNVIISLAFISLVYLSFMNYLLFHSMIEMFCVVVAFSMFVISINTSHLLQGGYFTFLGLSYGFVGLFDLLHALAYKGMGVFTGYDANMPTQLWIISRGLETLSLLVAPLFFHKKISSYIIIGFYAIVSVVALLSVFYWRVFPDCYIEGSGLTEFKKASEYVISGILVIALLLIQRKKACLHPKVLRFVMVSFLAMIVSELSFTFYVSVYGLSNITGHLFSLISFYCFYKSLVETSLIEPQKVLYFELEAAKNRTQKINKQLEEQIGEQKKTEEVLNKVNRALKVLSESNKALIDAAEELMLLNDVCRIIVETGGYFFAWVGFAEPDGDKTVRPAAHSGYEEGYLKTINITWADNERGRGPTGKAIRLKKTCIVKNILQDPDYSLWRDEAAKRGYASTIALPLILNDRAFGVLNIYAKEQNAFDQEESILLEKLSENLSYGMMLLRTRAEHRRAERALRDSEERLRLITDNMLDMIFLTDSNLDILYVNPAFERNLGIAPRDLVGKSIFDRVHPEDLPGVVAAAEKALNTKSFSTAVFRYRHADGRYLWIEGFGNIYFREDGTIAGAVIANRDISERKRAEEELAEARKKAERAERLASLGTMAAGIAHEINQPLNHIKIIAEEVLFWHELKGVFDPEKVLSDLKEISAQTDRIDKIIKRMRVFVRNEETPELEPCDLNRAVEEALKMIGTQLSLHGVKIFKSLLNTLPPIQGEQCRLEEVVVNLLINAMHALDSVNKTDKEVTITTSVSKKNVLLSIHDNAAGVSQELKDKIFEPFFTTKEFGESMGLGLSIVHSIVTSFGGEIQVATNEKGGATFTVEFSVFEISQDIGGLIP